MTPTPLRRLATIAAVAGASVTLGAPGAFADDYGSSHIGDGSSTLPQSCTADPLRCPLALMAAGSSGSSQGSSGISSATGSFGDGLGPRQNSPSQACGATTKSGRDGITTTWHDIGRRGPTSFVLSYDTEYVPDEIDVWYDRKFVATTGWVGNASGGTGVGSIRVNLPPGTDTSVMVRVTGGTDTIWRYTVHCP